MVVCFSVAWLTLTFPLQVSRNYLNYFTIYLSVHINLQSVVTRHSRLLSSRVHSHTHSHRSGHITFTIPYPNIHINPTNKIPSPFGHGCCCALMPTVHRLASSTLSSCSHLSPTPPCSPARAADALWIPLRQGRGTNTHASAVHVSRDSPIAQVAPRHTRHLSTFRSSRSVHSSSCSCS